MPPWVPAGVPRQTGKKGTNGWRLSDQDVDLGDGLVEHVAPKHLNQLKLAPDELVRAHADLWATSRLRRARATAAERAAPLAAAEPLHRSEHHELMCTHSRRLMRRRAPRRVVRREGRARLGGAMHARPTWLQQVNSSAICGAPNQ